MSLRQYFIVANSIVVLDDFYDYYELDKLICSFWSKNVINNKNHAHHNYIITKNVLEKLENFASTEKDLSAKEHLFDTIEKIKLYMNNGQTIIYCTWNVSDNF